MRALVLALGLASFVAHAENQRLVRGIKLAEDLRFAAAAKEFEAALRVPNNDRATVLRILEHLGVAWSTLNNPKGAEAFRKLMVLDPNYRLSAEYAPRVMTPFYESKGWATEHAPLSAEAEDPEFDGARGRRLSVRIADELGLVRAVRFHVRSDGGAWEARAVRPQAGTASIVVAGATIEWWIELLGDSDAQLALLHSEAAPRVDTAARPGDTAAAPGDPRPASGTAALGTAQPHATRNAEVRTAGYVLVGVGAAAALAGLGFGLSAEDARRKLGAATFDPEGRVNSLTQVQALELERRQATGALVANTALISAGGLAIAGVVMWLVGAPAEQVALVPGPGGMMVVGVFH